MEYASVLSLLKEATQRPVTIGFSASEPLAAGSAGVECTFTEPGSLGLKLNDHEKGAVVVRINPGSQGEAHTQLCPGLVVRSVGGKSVEGMEYSGVLSLLKSSKQRPITLTFDDLTAPAPALVLEEAEGSDDESTTAAAAKASGAGRQRWQTVRERLAIEYKSIISSYTPSPRRGITPSPRREDPPPKESAEDQRSGLDSAVTLGAWSRGLAAFAVRAGLSAGYSQHDGHTEALQMASLAHEAAVATTDIEIGAENDKCKRSQLLIERLPLSAQHMLAQPLENETAV